MKTASNASIISKLLIASITAMSLLFALSCKSESTLPSSQPASTPQASQSTAQPTPSIEIKLYNGTGLVTKVVRENPYDKSDRTAASVEMDHEEIVGLMPAMRMEFYVKDVSLLDGIKVGDTINFTIEAKGGTEIISAIKKK